MIEQSSTRQKVMDISCTIPERGIAISLSSSVSSATISLVTASKKTDTHSTGTRQHCSGSIAIDLNKAGGSRDSGARDPTKTVAAQQPMVMPNQQSGTDAQNTDEPSRHGPHQKSHHHSLSTCDSFSGNAATKGTLKSIHRHLSENNGSIDRSRIKILLMSFRQELERSDLEHRVAIKVLNQLFSDLVSIVKPACQEDQHKLGFVESCFNEVFADSIEAARATSVVTTTPSPVAMTSSAPPSSTSNASSPNATNQSTAAAMPVAVCRTDRIIVVGDNNNDENDDDDDMAADNNLAVFQEISDLCRSTSTEMSKILKESWRLKTKAQRQAKLLNHLLISLNQHHTRTKKLHHLEATDKHCFEDAVCTTTRYVKSSPSTPVVGGSRSRQRTCSEHDRKQSAIASGNQQQQQQQQQQSDPTLAVSFHKSAATRRRQRIIANACSNINTYIVDSKLTNDKNSRPSSTNSTKSRSGTQHSPSKNECHQQKAKLRNTKSQTNLNNHDNNNLIIKPSVVVDGFPNPPAFNQTSSSGYGSLAQVPNPQHHHQRMDQNAFIICDPIVQKQGRRSSPRLGQSNQGIASNGYKHFVVVEDQQGKVARKSTSQVVGTRQTSEEINKEILVANMSNKVVDRRKHSGGNVLPEDFTGSQSRKSQQNGGNLIVKTVDDMCPICSSRFAPDASKAEIQRHISQCLDKCTNGSVRSTKVRRPTATHRVPAVTTSSTYQHPRQQPAATSSPSQFATSSTKPTTTHSAIASNNGCCTNTSHRLKLCPFCLQVFKSYDQSYNEHVASHLNT